MEFISPNYHLIKNNYIAFICLQKAGKVCTFLHSRRAQRKVLLSSRRVIRMQQKYIQKLIDIRGRANISRNSLFNHLLIDLEPFENSAAALRGSWQPSHYLWIGRRQCYLLHQGHRHRHVCSSWKSCLLDIDSIFWEACKPVYMMLIYDVKILLEVKANDC